MDDNKRTLSCFFLFLLGLIAPLTIMGRPNWVDKLPQSPKRSNFYYHMTKTEGSTYEQAYSRAYRMVIQMSAARMGVVVNIRGQEDHDISDVFSEESITSVRIPVNSVCSYQENLIERNGIRLFVLWQVAKDVAKTPDFKEFNKCNR